MRARLFDSPAAAQGVGAIGGTVADESGAVLPGATVTLSNPPDDRRQSDRRDRRARRVSVHQAGAGHLYRARRAAGFRRPLKRTIVVNADVTARVDLQLEIGALEEGIIVKGESPLLDTTQR